MTYFSLLALVCLAPACATTTSPASAPAAQVRSPGGHHAVAIHGNAIFVDGRRMQPPATQLLTAPIWRDDDDAVAWVEQRGAATQLVVLPRLSSGSEPLVWPLPRLLADDRVHWAAHTRVVVGPELLTPRASVSWTEDVMR